jgi:hypothetical protein
MITWHIEHGGKTIQLNHVEASVIRKLIDPIKDQLGILLSDLEAEPDELQIVFIVDEEGHVSISLRGSSFIVNLAQDQIGDERRLGERVS